MSQTSYHARSKPATAVTRMPNSFFTVEIDGPDWCVVRKTEATPDLMHRRQFASRIVGRFATEGEAEWECRRILAEMVGSVNGSEVKAKGESHAD